MEQGWIKIRTYTTVVEAEIIKQMLIENDVPAVVMNKQDVFIRFGKVELYVQPENEQRAIDLIEKNSNPED